MLLLKLILSLCADRPRTLLSVLHYTLYRFLGIIREEILGFLIKLDEEGLSVQWWGKKDDWLWLLISFSSSRRRNQTWTLNVTQHSAVDRKLNQKHLEFLTAPWQNQAVLKVSRSRNKIVEPQLLPKNERTNLFFYPDDSEILET